MSSGPQCKNGSCLIYNSILKSFGWSSKNLKLMCFFFGFFICFVQFVHYKSGSFISCLIETIEKYDKLYRKQCYPPDLISD